MKRSGPEIVQHQPSSGTGFTLIELLVVIAIILIVGSIALPAYGLRTLLPAKPIPRLPTTPG